MPKDKNMVLLKDFLIANGFQAVGKDYPTGSETIEILSDKSIDMDRLWIVIKKYLTGMGEVFRDSVVFEGGGLDVMHDEKIKAFIHITQVRSRYFCTVNYQYLNPR